MKTVESFAGQVNPGRLFRFMKDIFITASVAFVCYLILMTPQLNELFTWHRSDPVGIEIWMSHLTHWSAGHYFWDALMFLGLGVFIERHNRRLLIVLMATCPFAITMTTWLLEDHITYRGLSGFDCSLYAAALIIAYRKSWISRGATAALIILVAGKSLIEIATGSTLFVNDLPAGVTPVPWAHISGTLAGLIISLICSGGAVGHRHENPILSALNPSSTRG